MSQTAQQTSISTSPAAPASISPATPTSIPTATPTSIPTATPTSIPTLNLTSQEELATRAKISLERALLKQFQFQNAYKYPTKKARNVKTVTGQAFTEEAWLNQLREKDDAKLLKQTHVEIAAAAEEEIPAKKSKTVQKVPKDF